MATEYIEVGEKNRRINHRVVLRRDGPPCQQSVHLKSQEADNGGETHPGPGGEGVSTAGVDGRGAAGVGAGARAGAIGGGPGAVAAGDDGHDGALGCGLGAAGGHDGRGGVVATATSSDGRDGGSKGDGDDGPRKTFGVLASSPKGCGKRIPQAGGIGECGSNSRGWGNVVGGGGRIIDGRYVAAIGRLR
ncbi:hypothetical protein ANO11243_053120 [Dothideomycetidae sp. 11243]|nr:hypothetical protein ANO11243_053120 [fungal sp. No.11243]